MISIRNLSTRYSKKSPEVLHGVDFELGKGEAGVVMGPNGSGKSTLLRCLLGLMKHEGQILLNGAEEEIKMSLKQRARILSFVPQLLTFSPMTVHDAVMAGRVSRFLFAPSLEDEQVVSQAIEDVGMGAYLSRNVEELSGGERQKVAVARALAQEAEIMLLDEPTSNLDIAAEMTILRLVRDLAKKRGITLLMSIHDVNLAYAIGDRFLFLKEGRVAYDVAKSEVNETILSDVFGVAMHQIDSNGEPYFIYERREI